ncbi:MAG TPA: cytochrome c oxidase subunit II, partial [Fimbriimonas sp.]|nr:cytochrome c oxidase subunit II [Fimbriimonas sp.]
MFPFSMSPPAASNWAAENDAIFYTLCLMSAFFTLLVVGFVIFFAIRYRAGTKADRSRPVYEDMRLEIGWTVIPLFLALIMFYFGAKLYVEEKSPPANAEDIFVVGKQWMWHMEHRNGVRENNILHIPVDKPVKLTMISQDVIHAFYVPAFRVQWMVIPGRYTSIWFTPTQVGEYHLFCNMYCGTQHSEMGGKVVVMSQPDYERWLANQGESAVAMTMEQAGARMFHHIGCDNCHGAVDTPRAPSLVGIYGSKQVYADGSAATVNDDILHLAIVRPYDKLVKGYDESMPAYQGQLSENDILDLIAYIKTMGTPAQPVVAG